MGASSQRCDLRGTGQPEPSHRQSTVGKPAPVPNGVRYTCRVTAPTHLRVTPAAAWSDTTHLDHAWAESCSEVATYCFTQTKLFALECNSSSRLLAIQGHGAERIKRCR